MGPASPTTSRTDSLSPVPEDTAHTELCTEKATLSKKMQILEGEFNLVKGNYLDAKNRELDTERDMVIDGKLKTTSTCGGIDGTRYGREASHYRGNTIKRHDVGE